MIKYICDKCGKELEPIEFVWTKNTSEDYNKQTKMYIKTNTGKGYREFDLCGECRKEMLEWFNHSEI